MVPSPFGSLRRHESAHGRLNDFGAIADVYDELVDWAPYGLWANKLESTLEEWGLPARAHILDVACGTGLSTLPWLERGYPVVGVDRSPAMLARAAERVRNAGFKAEFRQGDMLDLSPSGDFEAAVCMHSGLDYILDNDDLRRAFRSLRGTLMAGGLLAFDKCLDVPSFYDRDREDRRTLSCGTATFRYHWDRRRKLLVQRCTVRRTDGSLPARTAVTYHLRATPPDELVEMVEEAGFRTLEAPREFSVTDPGTAVFRAV